VNRKENPVTISCADIAILDQDVLGVLGEMRGFEDAYSWGTVGFERSWGELWISEPGKIAAVELDVFSGDQECVVLGMGGIERDLCGLDLVDDVKRSIVLTHAERDGQLATSGDRKDSEGSVTALGKLVTEKPVDFVGSISRIPGRSEVDGSGCAYKP